MHGPMHPSVCALMTTLRQPPDRERDQTRTKRIEIEEYGRRVTVSVFARLGA